MNDSVLKKIKAENRKALLNRYSINYSGMSDECIELYSDICIIAEMLSLPCQTLISDFKKQFARVYPFMNGSSVTVNILPADYHRKKLIGKKYISDAFASKSGICKKYAEFANRIFKLPEEEHLMPSLPLHPHCKCYYQDIYEEYPERVLQRVRNNALKFAKSQIGEKCGSLFCNIFVSNAFNVPNGRVFTGPQSQMTHGITHRNPSAKEFYYGQVDGFIRVFDPHPGDICVEVSSPDNPDNNLHGHVGIVSEYGKTISAASNGSVVENDWGFRPEQKSRVRFYRYIGDAHFPPL